MLLENLLLTSKTETVEGLTALFVCEKSVITHRHPKIPNFTLINTMPHIFFFKRVSSDNKYPFKLVATSHY